MPDNWPGKLMGAQSRRGPAPLHSWTIGVEDGEKEEKQPEKKSENSERVSEQTVWCKRKSKIIKIDVIAKGSDPRATMSILDTL